MDALICDFAQYYGIYELEKFDLKYLSILACGLPSESRTKKKLIGFKYSMSELMMASIIDHLAILIAQGVRKKNVKKPQSMVQIMTEKKEENEIQTFKTPEEFERERKRIIGEE